MKQDSLLIPRVRRFVSKILHKKRTFLFYEHFLKLSKHKEPRSQVQSKERCPETLEPNAKDGQNSEADQNGELTQQEPESHGQSENRNPEIPEPDTENGQNSDTDQNEELTLEDEINKVLEAAQSLPDLPPDEAPNISNAEISEPNTESVPELESVPTEIPVIEPETREPGPSGLPKVTESNSSGIQPNKKQMAMFWDGEVVESEKVPDVVFTKESYYIFYSYKQGSKDYSKMGRPKTDQL